MRPLFALPKLFASILLDASCLVARAAEILGIALHFCKGKASVVLAALPLSSPQRAGFERASLSSGEDAS